MSPGRSTSLLMLLFGGILLLFGVASQASVARTTGVSYDGDFLRWLLVSFVVVIAVRFVPPNLVFRRAGLAYAFALALLLLVPLIGEARYNAKRWIQLGGTSLQPSELMKYAFILLFARLLRRDDWNSGWKGFLLPAAVLVAPMLLILSQPDLGTSLLFVPTALAMLYAAGIRRRAIAVILAAGLVLAVLGYGELRPYQKERILSTLQRDRLTVAEQRREGYQLDQALRSVALGGIAGQGFAQGLQNRMNMLPMRQNDFVFAVIAEEGGFLGCLLLVAAVLGLQLVVFRVAWNCHDREGRLFAVGLGTLIGAQAAVHVGVNLGVVPTKGMPLPLVSAGGTALLACVSALAFVEGIGRRRTRGLRSNSFKDQLARLEGILRDRSASAADGTADLQRPAQMVDSPRLLRPGRESNGRRSGIEATGP